MTTDDNDALMPGPLPHRPPVISNLFPTTSISSPDSFQTVDLGATYFAG